MKKIVSIVITLLILFGASYGVSYFLHKNFIDYAFLVGIVISLGIWFFTSKGGYTSNNTDRMIQIQIGMKVDKQKYEFTPNLAFFTSLVYTIVTFALMIYAYKNYF